MFVVDHICVCVFFFFFTSAGLSSLAVALTNLFLHLLWDEKENKIKAERQVGDYCETASEINRTDRRREQLYLFNVKINSDYNTNKHQNDPRK